MFIDFRTIPDRASVKRAFLIFHMSFLGGLTFNAHGERSKVAKQLRVIMRTTEAIRRPSIIDR